MKIRSVWVVGWVAGAVVLFAFSQSGHAWQERGKKVRSKHLIFLRAFSAAEDVRGMPHPILNKSLDIIAGPKDVVDMEEVLQQPYSITTDSDHRVFVTDVRARAVHVFDFKHSKYSLLRGGDALRMPMGIAADAEGNIYVSDSGSGEVSVYDAKGRFSRYLTNRRGQESYFETPRGIAVEPATQYVYVCDTSRQMVIVLEKSGRVLARFGVRGGGDAPGEFRLPTQIAVASDELFVLDTGNRRLQILDKRGHFKDQIKLADIDNRSGLAVDSERKIYLTAPQLNQIQVFARGGKLLYQFGEAGNGAGQFNGVSGLWIDSPQCLYVADGQNKRVQLFRIDDGPRGAPC